MQRRDTVCRKRLHQRIQRGDDRMFQYRCRTAFTAANGQTAHKINFDPSIQIALYILQQCNRQRLGVQMCLRDRDKDGHFKFVVAEGVNEPGPIFTFGDTNMRTRFTCGAREFCNRWSEAGPTHHMAAATGRHIDTILKVAKIFNIPVDVITR